jgi:hypothetical protein
MTTYGTIDEAVAELRRHPGKPVRANCGDLAVELRAVSPSRPPIRLGDSLASLGPWEGESTDELMSRLREARESGGSAEPPRL